MDKVRPQPWLSIIGIGEDGLQGLPLASRQALDAAEIVFGGSRHLQLADVGVRGEPWPMPFDVTPVLKLKGRNVAVVVSGDPFWFGGGGSLARHLDPAEWIAYPVASTFSLIAARLGWRIEETICLGLHAAAFERLVPVLSRGAKLIALVRDGAAAGALCAWLTERGWGASRVIAFSAVGGPKEKLMRSQADKGFAGDVVAPVAVAIEADGRLGLPRCSGLPDDLFINDGQITKRPIRALALSALAPRAGERLWDIGAGSGSISIEWVLAGGEAFAIEQHAARAANVRANAEALGVGHRVHVIEGAAPEALSELPAPDAVFVGGGLTAETFEDIWRLLPGGVRFVAHAVSLETQALLMDLQGRRGGTLDRFEVSHAEPLGRMRSWQSARPIVQWVTSK